MAALTEYLRLLLKVHGRKIRHSSPLGGNPTNGSSGLVIKGLMSMIATQMGGQDKPAQRFNRIHAICTYLRGKSCQLCPAWRQTPYGKGKPGCYRLAQEVLMIAQHGSPWPKKNKKNMAQWRKRFNEQ